MTTDYRALAQPEPQGSATLNWSEERQPCEQCRYNHCIAETPFGRFLISWKGWKDYPAVTVDEAPFGEWFECWNSVEKAKSACQAEYNRRLAAAVGSLPSQPVPVGPTDEELDIVVIAIQRLAPDQPDGPTQPTHDLHAVDRGREILKQHLARYARPAIEPVPVSERPWEREGWCDAEGRCWMVNELLEWAFRKQYKSLDSYYFHGYTHLLPHWALPLPTPNDPQPSPPCQTSLPH